MKAILRLGLCVAIGYALLAQALESWAQGGPPLETDDTGTTPRNHWEINLAGTVEHIRSARSYEMPLADINYGISSRAQVKWEFPWIWQQTPGSGTTGGLGDSTIGVRYRFIDETRTHPAMSTYPALSFNNSNSSVHRGLVDRQTAFFLPLEVQKDLGRIGLNIEAGYNLSWGAADEWAWGVAIGRQVNSRLELIGEVHTVSETGRHQQTNVIDAGFRYQLDPENQLLFAIGTGLHGPAEDRPSIIGYLGLHLSR